MDRSSEGSSVDPDDALLFGDGSCKYKKQHSPTSDLGHSLSTLDLEKDAVPCTPDSLSINAEGFLQGFQSNQGQQPAHGPLSPQLQPSQIQQGYQGQDGTPRLQPSTGLPPQGLPSSGGIVSATGLPPSQDLQSSGGLSSAQGLPPSQGIASGSSHPGQASSSSGPSRSSSGQSSSSSGQESSSTGEACSHRDNHQLCSSESSDTTTETIAQPPPGETADSRLDGVTSPGSSSTPGPQSSKDIPPPQTTGSGSGADACRGAQSQQVDSDKNILSIERESSLDSISPPKDETFDAVIICHEDDSEMVCEMKEKLNKLILYDGTTAKVATENDNASLGKGETEHFDDWLQKAEYMFFLVNRKFCRDFTFQANVAIVDSLMYSFCKKEYVIPIFLENKFSKAAQYIKPSMRAIKGINYYNTSWEEIEPTFKENLNKAREKRKKREKEEKLKDLDNQD